MKKFSFLICSLCFLSQGICGMAYREVPVAPLMVGHHAPDFIAHAVVNGTIVDDFSLNSLKGKYAVLLFYPLDFTFVCPTELHAFQDRFNEFAERNAQVIAISVDSAYSHLAWLNTPASSGGIQGIEYPLVSDLDKSISRSFNVLDESQGIAYRGLVLIDRNGIIRHFVINDLPLGRSVDETLRMLDALITYEDLGEVCPANWKKGEKTMKPTAEGLLEYFGG
jgi:peroxiredoxin (alkyl hydroperoxide reductase subunit C)